MQCFYRNIWLGIVAGFFSVLLSAPLQAQTAARLEALLNQPELSWSEAAAFVLEASETEGYSNGADAFSHALEQKWLPKKALSEGPVHLNGIALLLMRSFDLKGGIFYSLFKNPHHAYRELVYKQVIRGETDPDMIVSGSELLLMISRLLTMEEAKEEQQL